MKKQKMSGTTQMLLALALGVIVGIIMMVLKNYLISSGNDGVWAIIDKIFFADITQSGNGTAIGIFFIIKTLFINALQFSVVPLVITSISLSLCSLTDTVKLGRIATKTILGFLMFYVLGSILAISASVLCINTGFFQTDLTIPGISSAVDEYTVANPLNILINTVPSNLVSAMTSNSQILAVIFIAVILGLCMNFYGNELKTLRQVVEDCAVVVNKYLDVIINKCGPVCIFSMLVYTFAAYGMEQIAPLLRYMLVAFLCMLFFQLVAYPVVVGLICRTNPLKFLRKMFKVIIWAYATNSSAATLPLTRKTCIEELGCSEEVADFVLPLGMTINMNGTTIEHIIAVSFIATAAGLPIAPITYLTIMLLAIGSSAGTPAIPNAGTIMLYATLTGAGFSADMCIALYSLLLTLNKPIDMCVTTLNVAGDAATACVVSHYENSLNRERFNT